MADGVGEQAELVQIQPATRRIGEIACHIGKDHQGSCGASGSLVNLFNQRLHGGQESAADRNGRTDRSCCRGICCNAEGQAAAIMGLLDTGTESFTLHGVARQLFFKRGPMHIEILPQIDERRCTAGQKRKCQKRDETKATHDGLQSQSVRMGARPHMGRKGAQGPCPDVSRRKDGNVSISPARFCADRPGHSTIGRERYRLLRVSIPDQCFLSFCMILSVQARRMAEPRKVMWMKIFHLMSS